MAVESRMMRLKLSVSSRAVMAGMTSAAAINVTPRICSAAISVAASSNAKSVSIQGVRTP